MTEQCLEQGGTVITVNRRLFRELRQQYDQIMVRSGQAAWESPDILPWSTWVRRCWDMGPGQLPKAPVVLTDHQLNLVWQDIIQNDIQDNHQGESSLWNIKTTARSAVRTLRLMRQWCLEKTDLPLTTHPDHEGFQRWLRVYETQCTENNWVDMHRLADQLTGTELPLQDRPLHLTGLDIVTTQQQQLIQRLLHHHIQVEVAAPPYEDFQKCPCHVFPSKEDQWGAVAHWTRERLLDNPDDRIAVVVPDLRNCRDELVAALMDALAPGQIVHPGENRTLPFHVSLGDPLSLHPAGRNLIFLLDMIVTEQSDLEQTEALLRSPWIAHYRKELVQRSQTALKLRTQLPWKHTIREFHAAIDRLDCPLLAQQIGRAITLKDTAPSRAPLSDWSVFISSLLDIFGWPGEDVSLNSDHYQAIRSIREQIIELGTFEVVSRQTGLSRAVSLLGQLLGSQVFQPETGAARVQVLGTGEIPGLEFDHVWFANLIEEQWPLPEAPDPFLPVTIQQAAGCPNADPESALKLARITHARLAASTPNLVQSRPERIGDTLLIASPLITDCPRPDNDPEISPALFWQLQTATSHLRAVHESSGPPCAKGAVSGGATLIQSQSICPRGAFLRYRLGACHHAFNQTGLNAAKRGQLVHQVLDQIWTVLENSRNLAKTNSHNLHSLITSCIDQTSKQYHTVSGCGQAFFHAQHDWLAETLTEWFELERSRSMPFTVIGREERVQLTLEGLELTVRIDRIDQFEDGSLMLIDYKTGSTRSTREWFEERTQEPQLPLYALAKGHTGEGYPISAIAYAKIQLGNCSLTGNLDPGVLDSNIGQFGDHSGIVLEPFVGNKTEKNLADIWGQQSYWHKTLGNLAQEYRAGDVRINPRNKGICTDCPAPAFCRGPNQNSTEDDAV